MPEGHPDIDVDEDGTASVAEGTDADKADGDAAATAGTDADDAASEDDPLTRANNFFDMGMAAMESAQDEESQQQATGLFAQAVEYYDEYLATASSSSAEVDRAICVCSTRATMRAPSPTWRPWSSATAPLPPRGRTSACSTNRTGDTAKAKKAYQQALDAAKKGRYVRRQGLCPAASGRPERIAAAHRRRSPSKGDTWNSRLPPIPAPSATWSR